MKYSKVLKGRFISRPNRFIAYAEVDGEVRICHVKNTGRCRELLVEGATVYLSESSVITRKTKYDLIAVEKKKADGSSILINMDSAAPNAAVAEWLSISSLFPSDAEIRSEVTYGRSRFDFAVTAGKSVSYLEVKGVTLEEDGIAMFPDAPTERGVKHLHELALLAQSGVSATAVFVIQMKGVTAFRPNVNTHREFAEALRQAAKQGVRIIAVDCVVKPDGMVIDSTVHIDLD